jgi:hypothetical protein
MAVQSDIDGFDAQGTQVHARHDRLRRAEHHIGQLRRNHRAAPAVGQAGAQRMQRRICIVIVDTHVRAMKHLHVLAVDTPGCNAELFEQFPSLLRQPVEEADVTLAAAEVFHHRFCKFACHLVDAPVARFDTPLLRKRQQLRFVANLIAAGLAGG